MCAENVVFEKSRARASIVKHTSVSQAAACMGCWSWGGYTYNTTQNSV